MHFHQSFLLSLWCCFLFILLPFDSKSQHLFSFQNNTTLTFDIEVQQTGTFVLADSLWQADASQSEAWRLSQVALSMDENIVIPEGEEVIFDIFLRAGNGLELQFSVLQQSNGSFLYQIAGTDSSDLTWYPDTDHERTFAGIEKTYQVKHKLGGKYGRSGKELLLVLHDPQSFVIDAADFENPNVLNVLTQNVQFLPPPIGHRTIALRGDHLAENLPDYLDVVCLQEAIDDTTREWHLDPAFEAAGYAYKTEILNPEGENLYNGGVIFYSKWPIEKSVDWDYTECNFNAGDCLANKGIQYCRINKLGKTYHLFGTHVEAGGQEDDLRIKHTQYGEQRAFIAAQNIPSNEPVLFAGDFNTKHGSDMYQALFDSIQFIAPTRFNMPLSTSTDISYFDESVKWNVIDYVLGMSGYQLPIEFTNHFHILRGIQDNLWGYFDFGDHFAVFGRAVYPAISTSSTNELLCEEDPLSLDVTINHPVAYQWFYNGEAIEGANDASFEAISVEEGAYYCEMSYSYSHEHTFENTIASDTTEVRTIDANFQPAIWQQGDTLFTDLPAYIQWYRLGEAIEGATDTYFIPNEAGLYQVAESNGKCSSALSAQINWGNYTNIGIHEEWQVEVFPSPFQEMIQVKLPAHTQGIIRVYDVQGKLFFEQTTDQINASPINTVNWPIGTYTFVVETMKGKQSIRVVKLNK